MDAPIWIECERCYGNGTESHGYGFAEDCRKCDGYGGRYAGPKSRAAKDHARYEAIRASILGDDNG